MWLALTALGVDSGVQLFHLAVAHDGRWTYESRAVAEASGTLPRGEMAQVKSLVDAVPWEAEVLNMPVSADDRTLFRLQIRLKDDDERLYQCSEAVNHASWQFRDLLHFLRHNIAGARRAERPVQESPPDWPHVNPSH